MLDWVVVSRRCTVKQTSCTILVCNKEYMRIKNMNKINTCAGGDEYNKEYIGVKEYKKI